MDKDLYEVDWWCWMEVKCNCIVTLHEGSPGRCWPGLWCSGLSVCNVDEWVKTTGALLQAWDRPATASAAAAVAAAAAPANGVRRRRTRTRRRTRDRRRRLRPPSRRNTRVPSSLRRRETRQPRSPCPFVASWRPSTNWNTEQNSASPSPTHLHPILRHPNQARNLCYFFRPIFPSISSPTIVVSFRWFPPSSSDAKWRLHRLFSFVQC